MLYLQNEIKPVVTRLFDDLALPKQLKFHSFQATLIYILTPKPRKSRSYSKTLRIFQVSSIANNDGEVTKEEFLNYARHSEFFKTQMDKTDSDSMAHKQEAIAKAERAFKLFDKDNDGYLSCFQKKIHKERNIPTDYFKKCLQN